MRSFLVRTIKSLTNLISTIDLQNYFLVFGKGSKFMQFFVGYLLLHIGCRYFVGQLNQTGEKYGSERRC
jgi:hypothetical protein